MCHAFVQDKPWPNTVCERGTKCYRGNPYYFQVNITLSLMVSGSHPSDAETQWGMLAALVFIVTWQCGGRGVAVPARTLLAASSIVHMYKSLLFSCSVRRRLSTLKPSPQVHDTSTAEHAQ